MNERFTSRKFVLAVLALGCSFVLCWFGKIGAGEFVTALSVTVGAYLAANVTQKVKA